MAIMFVRAQMISRGAGRSVISAAAYRHRARMMDEQAGTSFSYRGGSRELVHEELALPDDIPDWLRSAIEGKPVAMASEVFWNAVNRWEKRPDAQLARELILALPEELTRIENIALVREFVTDHFTSKGMVADWVFHDKDGNPHIHMMTTLRPLTVEGFGPKKVPVRGLDGEPLRVVTPDRPKGKIVYKLWAGDVETMQAWKIAWAQTANRHLANAGYEMRLDGRSYAEQGLEGIGQRHLGPKKAALARKGIEMYFAPAALSRRQALADRLLAQPEFLLKQLGNEKSTFDERDIARALHRYVDDPLDFANIRARLMASRDLVLLRPQQVGIRSGDVKSPAIFTTRQNLRVEYDMARSAEALSRHKGHAISGEAATAAIKSIETHDTKKRFRFEPEQVDAVHHITRESAIAAIVGLAGAGKSTLLAAARIAWEGANRRVMGAALAGKAAEGLEDSSGIPSRTLASWELSWASGRERLNRGDVLVIDEAGMISSQQMARILKIAEEAQAKIVLVGDAMQAQPIQAGAAFRAITERIGFAELAGVRRQRDEWAREASRLFARGRIEEALDAYVQRGHIVVADTRDELVELIVADWSQARRGHAAKLGDDEYQGSLRGDQLLVLAHTNEDVKRLNLALRKVMKKEGALVAERGFRTERGLREFGAGDRIIFLENARFLEARARHLGPQYVKNGMLGTVVSSTGKWGTTVLSVRLDSGREVVISEDSYRNVDYGYAATIHKSQGMTVERTFVLASGMMDQHLTYVSMTRHRNRVDLYAAHEDFELKPQLRRRRRFDHAAGITGELVETGEAKFRPRDEDCKESPYADVRADDGRVHRFWGISLPKALAEGGISVGDTITLLKEGLEPVRIKISAIDEQTGEKYREMREGNRNVWAAKQVETAKRRLERIERESHRPKLFGPLVERLGRSGAKSTTLDFEGEDAYRAHVRDFARRRGINTLAEIAAGVEEGFSRRVEWVQDRWEQMAKLWPSASFAPDFATEREPTTSHHEERSVGEYLISPTTTFAHSISEDARRAQLASKRWKEREAILQPLLDEIYRDPKHALSRLNTLASDAGVEPRGLADHLVAMPQTLGRLRGSDSMVDGRTARGERKAAMAALTKLLPLARVHATEFRRQATRFIIREKQRRADMSLAIPAPSKTALARLSEIEAVRDRGGEDAYKVAFAYAVADRRLAQEVKAVDDALTARFGWGAFSAKEDGIAEHNVLERMPGNIDLKRREQLARLFAAIRNFAENQHLAERWDRSKIVAGASVRAAKEAATILPMLAAVTEFKVSVEEVARERALAASHYRHCRQALAETATRIWRDPAGSVDKIETLVVKGVSGDRIAKALGDDPAAYGVLRGSGRFMDRLLAIGRERKDGLDAVPTASVRVRLLAAAYVEALATETRAIIEERRCMRVEIPGLSQRAEDELVRIAADSRKKGGKLYIKDGSFDPVITHEFSAVNRALDERFGRNALLRGEKDVINRVSAPQRRAFEAMRDRLVILQRIVRTQRSQEIILQRRQRSIDSVRDIAN